ncbi:MAG TPA: hypothetical protein VFQ38_12700 [Longimicrobiales bacterium]|nr:hypothetical protein [Longimicrobiales bacterium]
MRTPSAVVAISVIGLVAACSRPKPAANAGFDADLDLALRDLDKPAAVASPLELAGEVKAQPRAASHSGTATPVRHHKKPTMRKPAPKARVVEPEPQPKLAGLPAPASAPPAAEPAPAPEPEPEPADPAPQDEPRHGGGWGGWSGPTDVGTRMPGMPGGVGIGLPGGGVIILRGGHSGIDPCDEHDRRGRGGIGGVMIPGMPGGRIGGGFPRGGIFRFRR